MGAPKPGDRVRVTETYEGVWTSRPTHGSGMWGVVAAKDYDVDFQVTNYASVEVLSLPVYVNHDTTEYRDGDVVRDRVIGVVWVRTGGGWLNPATGYHCADPNNLQLILVVRDGQAIA